VLPLCADAFWKREFLGFVLNPIRYSLGRDTKYSERMYRSLKGGRTHWREVYRLAGALGVDPDRLTLRELYWMAEGRNQQTWNVASAIMALLANCHRDPKKRPFLPGDFHPMVDRKNRGDVIEVTPETLGDFREAFSGFR
jgi:hypothetical protein